MLLSIIMRGDIHVKKVSLGNQYFIIIKQNLIVTDNFSVLILKDKED